MKPRKRLVRCKHDNFMCNCEVNRLSSTEGGPINRYTLDVRVKCVTCDTPFRFIGLPAGVDLNGAATSMDACEGRFAIAPKGDVVSVLEDAPMGFSVRASGTPRNEDARNALIDRLTNAIDEAIRKGSVDTYESLQSLIESIV